MTLVAVSAGETPTSKTRALALAALDAGGGGQLIELTDLSAEGLLGRTADRAVEEAAVAAADASILVLASPVYRATVSGALKAFLDRLPTQALEGTAVVLVATAASPLHYLSLDTSGRALVASLGGWSVPTVVYATGADFQDGVPSPALLDTLARALAEAAAVVGRTVSLEPARRPVVVIVGAGPTGTSLLERLVANLGDAPAQPVEVVLVDPHPPGAGRVWRWDRSPLLRMNSMAQDVTLFTDESVACDGPIRPGPSLIEWVDRVRAGIVEVPPEAAVEAEQVDGRSFPTRRLQSEYLAWAFRDTVRAAPPWVDVRVVTDEVVDVADAIDDRQEVALSSDSVLTADVVVLALGHLDVSAEDDHDRLAAFARQHHLVHLPPAYTADIDLTEIAPGATVIARGMGLAFVDLVVLLTEGRGGRFEPDGPNGRLRYVPSGEEPLLVTGSRRGVPYHAKTSYDLAAPRPAFPRFLTAEAVAALVPSDRPAELRRDLWPVVAKELAWGYYHELFHGHPDRTTVPFAHLDRALDELAWGSPELAEVVTVAVPDPEDRLDLDTLDRPLRGAPQRALVDLQADLRAYIEGDLARRSDARHSADLGLFHALLHCVVALPGLVGPILSARSRLEELDGWWFGYFSYLASGPPPRRLQELLALARADVVPFLGADIEVEADAARGRFVATSASTDAAIEATALVEARLPGPSVTRAAHPLVQALHRRGTCLDHELLDRSDGTRRRSGRLAVDATQRVRQADGTVHPTRFAVGVHTSRPAAGAFARPGTNAPSFRQHDAVARAILAGVARGEADESPQRGGARVSPLDDPARHALLGPQAHLAETRGTVRRFRPDVAPFYAFEPGEAGSWADAAHLAGSHRVVLARTEPVDAPAGWDLVGAHPCHQMVLTEVHPRERAGDAPVEVLGDADIPAMTELVRLARPGPFLPRTIELGRFVGVRIDGRLAAMAGERMRVEGHTEITAVCTHPDARGHGLGELVTHRVVAAAILARGERPFLHVAEGNEHARAVYDRLGFTTRRGIVFAAWRPPVDAAIDARAVPTTV